MPLISQQVLGILDGVSQQPDKMRAQGEAQTQVNIFDSIALGKVKRPPTRHVAKLLSAPTTFGGNSGAYIWPVNRDSVERYHIVVLSGSSPSIQVFDANTGQQYNVLTPNGVDYLKIQPPPTFTETLTNTDSFGGSHVPLESHISDSSFGWQYLNAGIGNPPAGGQTTSGLSITATGLQETTFVSGNAGVSAAVYDLQVPENDYSVTWAWTTTSTPFNYSLRFAAKIPNLTPVGSGLLPGGYALDVIAGSSAVVLSVISSLGILTTIGNWSATVNTANTNYTAELVFTGSSIKVLLNGTVLGTVTDATWSAGGWVAISGIDTATHPQFEWSLTNQKIVYTAPVTIGTPLQFGFRFTTIQDTTFIVNQSFTVAPKHAVTTPTRSPEALIVIRQVDYGTNYNVTLNGINFGYSTTSPNTVNSRQQLTSDFITQQILAVLQASTTLSGQFAYQSFGSTIYLTRNDGQDFTLAVSDGLTDNAIVAIKGSVQSQQYLPPRALNGFVVEVQPDPDNKFDAAFYIYDDLGNPSQNGIWREAAKPGILTTLDPTTMPWTLTRLGNVVAGFDADGGPPTAYPTLPAGLTTFNYATGSGCIGDQGSTTSATLDSHATGVAGQEITVTFDVNLVAGPSCSTGTLPASEYVTIQVTDSSQPGKTFSQIFYGGTNYPNQVIQFQSPATSGATISFTLLYSRGSTPPVAHQANIHIHQPSDSIPGITLGVPDATQLVIPSSAFGLGITYPQGVIFTVVAGSATQHYTLPTDLSYSALATAIAALTFTGLTVTNPSPGIVQFTNSGGGAPSVTASTNWNQMQDYHNGGLNLAPNSLVGYLIQNLTDGSEGVITANTSTTITVGAGLSGGTNNEFEPGNLVSVSGPNGQLYFVFNYVNWTPRGVGDDNTNPFPSFTFNPIQEVGFASGRLLFTSGENVIASGSSDVFDFFRTTVITLLDSDRIDVSGNNNQVSDWHSIVNWAEGTWLWAGNVQAQLPTQPALANSTVSIAPQTSYQSSPTLRPLSMDRRVYFARERTGDVPQTQIFTYQRIRFPFFGFLAQEATKKIPTYMLGSPLLLVGDPTLEIMITLTDQNGAQQNVIYPYVFHYDENQQLQQESWSTWQLDPLATIIGMDMLDGHLGLIVSRPDGVYLEDIDLQIALYDEV